MSTVQEEIEETARRVIETSVAMAASVGKADDLEWLLREMKLRVRTALVEAVWGAEKDAGREPGSTRTLRLK